MKRFLTILLAVCMALSLAAPAMAMTPPAPQDMEQALGAVTLLVKDTLRVDDAYTEFYGDFYEDIAPRWNLNWSDENRSLSVTCDENGKILDVHTYVYEDSSDRFYGFDPAFPALTGEEAKNQAEEWLGRILGEGETGRIDRTTSTLGEDASYRYYGTILLNGVESPLTFNLRVDKNGLKSFSRSDSYTPYVGELPGTATSVTEQAASQGLFSSVKLELYYILDEKTGEARLQYVPVGAYTVVDGVTGEVIDMDALYAEMLGDGFRGYAMDEAAAAEAPMMMNAMGGAALTEMELESIGNYGDAMTEGELDAILRTIPALGIGEDFSLQRCSYAMDSESGDITASLRYTAEMTEDNLYGFSKKQYRENLDWGNSLTVYKYITMNAKTGELISVSTSYPLGERDAQYSNNNPAVAEDFLARYAMDMYPSAALCTLSLFDQDTELVYARAENGYFYPENYLAVEVNPATGTVDTYHYSWDEDVTFADPTGILTEAEAERAYADALVVTLGYVAWPVEARRDDPELLRYIEWGYTWVERLHLGWYYGGTEDVTAIDAHTGEPILSTESGDGAFVYTDLENVPEKAMVEALGQAGIGFTGDVFEGEKTLTQREAVTLLLQAAGYDPSQWEEDTLLGEAVYQGFLTKETWNPEKTVTRMEFLKMLLGASRYGDAARLTGIWSTSFKDVSDSDLGYAALAEALGLSEGKKLLPDESCTRYMAAEMLFTFMSR